MKAFLTIIGCLLFCIAGTNAQELKNQDRPLTQLEELLTTNGTLFEKSYYEMGDIGCKGTTKLYVKVVDVWYNNSSKNMSGIIFEIYKIDKYSTSTKPAYLDLDSLDDLLSALQTMIDKANQMQSTPVEYKEIHYTTTSDVKLGFYQSGTEQGGFIRLDKWSSDARAFFGMNRFPEILALLKSAKTKIEML